MNNSVAFIVAIVLGILAIVVGFLYNANVLLGFHPTRAYAAWGVGVILIIVGIVGMVMARRRTI
jgi:uncharacterized membrane protein HdeD (DUF308 family)